MQRIRPVLALIIAAAVCAVAFVLTTLFASRLARSGHWDLVIDHARKIVRLTATSRSHTKEIPLEAIQRLAVLRVDRDTATSSGPTSYSVWAKLLDNTGVEMASFRSKQRAMRFGEWLSQQIGGQYAVEMIRADDFARPG